MVGGGPAGLSCAHRLAMHGHDVVIYDAREKIGGLNEYGIAAYKAVDDFAAAEVDFILSIGGITVETGKALGRDITLAELRESFDAVFLGLGLAGVNALGLADERLARRRGRRRLHRRASPGEGSREPARSAGGSSWSAAA